MDPVTRGRLLILVAALFWSLGGFFTRWVALPGPVMAFWRVLFAGVLLLPLAWVTARGRFPRRPGVLGYILAFAAMNILFITAMVMTTAANAIFLQYSAPFWMMLGSLYFFREHLDGRSAMGIAIAAVGIAVILSGGSTSSSDGTGILLALLSGVAFAGVGLWLRHLRGENALWLTALAHLGGAACLVPVFLAVGPGGWAGDPWAVSGADLGKLALFGIVQMGVPYILYSRGLAEVSAQEAGLIALLEPVLNPILVWWAFQEVPAAATVIGGGLILGAVTLRYIPIKIPRNRVGYG